jgi:hypothetical protein
MPLSPLMAMPIRDVDASPPLMAVPMTPAEWFAYSRIAIVTKGST